MAENPLTEQDLFAEYQESPDQLPEDYFEEIPLSAYQEDEGFFDVPEEGEDFGRDDSIPFDYMYGAPVQTTYSGPIPGDMLLPGPPPGTVIEPFKLAPPAYPLDDQQEYAASHGEGAALVLAGAGSGKTTVVIEMTGRRLESGVSPAGYVMLTFSRKAASEMRTRLKERLGFDSGVEPTTFHSFFFKLISKAPERFGVNKEFTIMDDKDQLKVFDMILDSEGIEVDRERFPSASWQKAYSLCKNECLRAQPDTDVMMRIFEIMRRDMGADRDSLTDSKLALALLSYEDYTQKMGLLDYDDIILRPLELFRASPEIAHEYSRQVNYLIVDESQDTNLAQYELIKSLGSANGNVVMVGDDDQSIYGWRGAHPENLTRFMQDFSAKQYLIENNYRCAPEIVKKATAQVRINTDRLEKDPKSKANQGTNGEVNVVTSQDSYTMSKGIINRIKHEMMMGAKPTDIAILYRTNRMLTEIEADLIREKIPYHVAGSSKLMDKAETKICIAIARLVVNNNDTPALWLVAKILNGVGDKAVSRLIAYADEMNKPLLSDDGINTVSLKKARESLLQLRATINILRRSPPASWISTIKRELEPLKPFRGEVTSNPAAYRRREASIDQLESWSSNLDCDNWHKLFEILLEQEDPEHKNNKEHVTVTTIHKAKGLEWDHVHFIGFSKGLFPMERRGDDNGDVGSKDVSEERRLSYVLMTRAKKQCFFYHSRRYRGDPKNSYSMSPFSEEISFTNYIKLEGPAQGGFGRGGSPNNRYGAKKGGSFKDALARKKSNGYGRQ